MNDESLYEEAAEELTNGNIKRGLWAKSYAAALGNEAQAKALYIRARVPQIIDELRQQSKILSTINCPACGNNYNHRMSHCPFCNHEKPTGS